MNATNSDFIANRQTRNTKAEVELGYLVEPPPPPSHPSVTNFLCVLSEILCLYTSKYVCALLPNPLFILQMVVCCIHSYIFTSYGLVFGLCQCIKIFILLNHLDIPVKQLVS